MTIRSFGRDAEHVRFRSGAIRLQPEWRFARRRKARGDDMMRGAWPLYSARSCLRSRQPLQMITQSWAHGSCVLSCEKSSRLATATMGSEKVPSRWSHLRHPGARVQWLDGIDHLGILRRAVLDHLVDTAPEPQTVAQFIAAMPPGFTRGSVESALKRNFDAGLIE